MTFKADQILGLDAFASNLGAEESITPLITLKGNSLRATLSPRSEQGSHSVCRIVVNPMMGNLLSDDGQCGLRFHLFYWSCQDCFLDYLIPLI